VALAWALSLIAMLLVPRSGVLARSRAH